MTESSIYCSVSKIAYNYVKVGIIGILVLLSCHVKGQSGDRFDEDHRVFNTLAYMDMVYADTLSSHYKEAKKIERLFHREKRAVLKKPLTLGLIFHLFDSSITLDDINMQISALNRDFGLEVIYQQHPNDKDGKNKKYASHTAIRFCLPEDKDNTEDREGIIRVEGQKYSWKDITNEMKFSISGGSDAIDPKYFINIWVVPLEDNNAGYAQMPGGNPDTDGIVINSALFARVKEGEHPYNQGKTLTHLMGNYLGLYPLWGRAPCQDDYVYDTPIHSGPNYGCPEGDHISICSFRTEMTMNFMDATDDHCMYMFTEGQMKRMQFMLSNKGPRKSLKNLKDACDE